MLVINANYIGNCLERDKNMGVPEADGAFANKERLDKHTIKMRKEN